MTHLYEACYSNERLKIPMNKRDRMNDVLAQPCSYCGKPFDCPDHEVDWDR